MLTPKILWINVAVNVALVGLLVFAVANPVMELFQGKAMNARAMFYPFQRLSCPPAGCISQVTPGITLPITTSTNGANQNIESAITPP